MSIVNNKSSVRMLDKAMSGVRNSKKAKEAIQAMEAFLVKHKLSEKEQNVFFDSAMRCAADALDCKEVPKKVLKTLERLSLNRDISVVNLCSHIEGCIVILKAMAKGAEGKVD